MIRPLSLRLEAVRSMLMPCRVFADVGTDHALLPISAVLLGSAERAIAADLRAPPLVSAWRNIERAGVQERVATLRGDGVAALAGHDVEVVSMAGISGTTMVALLARAPGVLGSLKQLVLQPNSDALLVRAWARENGWHLREERMIEENARFFLVCSLQPGEGRDPAYDTLDEAIALEVGPLLLARRDLTARRWCEQQAARIGKLVDKGAEGLAPELTRWRTALLQLA